MKVVVTGGGSGGHVFPALAVARRLIELGHEVSYVGAEGGMETRLVPEAGVPFHALPAGKYNRNTLQPREAWKALRGLAAARALLRRLKPRVVLSTGGFAGFPLAFVAEIAGVPVVLLEQNATLGLANRWLAPRARRIALAMDVNLPRKLAYKALVTGMPVREERLDARAAKEMLGFDPERPLLLVMGGSQGSRALNRMLPERLEPWLGTWQVLHQTGEQGLEETRARATGWQGYRAEAFVDAVPAWSAADAAVTRAGATTLAEAAYHGVPLLAVPLPSSVDGGAQERNARFYATREAALAADQEKPGDVAAQLERLLGDADLRAHLRENLHDLSPAGATERLAHLLLEVAE